MTAPAAAGAYVLSGATHGTVHTAGCEHVGQDAREWVWARGKDLEEVRDRVAASGQVRACFHCDPLHRRPSRRPGAR